MLSRWPSAGSATQCESRELLDRMATVIYPEAHFFQKESTMISRQVRGDIFQSEFNHTVFAINTEGHNDAGFAGLVSSKFWPELSNTGEKELGAVLSKEVSPGQWLHGLVCHSLSDNGWAETPNVVRDCLDSIPVEDDEEIGAVLMGSGPIGRMMGADVNEILRGIDSSKKKVAVFTL